MTHAYAIIHIATDTRPPRVHAATVCCGAPAAIPASVPLVVLVGAGDDSAAALADLGQELSDPKYRWLADMLTPSDRAIVGLPPLQIHPEATRIAEAGAALHRQLAEVIRAGVGAVTDIAEAERTGSALAGHYHNRRREVVAKLEDVRAALKGMRPRPW